MSIESVLQYLNNNQLECSLTCSYLEIYNENVRDLLCENQNNLMVIEDAVKGM